MPPPRSRIGPKSFPTEYQVTVGPDLRSSVPMLILLLSAVCCLLSKLAIAERSLWRRSLWGQTFGLRYQGSLVAVDQVLRRASPFVPGYRRRTKVWPQDAPSCAVGSSELKGALVKIGNPLTEALAVTAVFTGSYNATICVQCLAGLLD
jgi:hypothetical protein